MERTKQPTGKKRRSEYIKIPHDLMEQILRYGGSDALAVYMFYLFNANWQDTNQPYTTEKYCLKRLAMGQTRFRNAKRVLETMKLVSGVHPRFSDGSYDKWYIRINSMVSGETLENKRQEVNRTNEDVLVSEGAALTPVNPPDVRLPDVRKQTSNALKHGEKMLGGVRETPHKTTELTQRAKARPHLLKTRYAKFIIDDGIRYNLWSDGRYRHGTITDQSTDDEIRQNIYIP